jgi:N-acetylglutamate synthase-like GNAT family acetyltransferase
MEDIKKNLENRNIMVALEKEKILGYIFFYYCLENEFLKEHKLKTNDVNKNIAVLKNIVCKVSGKGVGTNLVKSFLAHIKKNGIEAVYTPIWESKNGANFKKLAENFNFTKLYNLKNYWHKDSLNKENYCPVCNTPCNCNNLIYRLKIL